MPVRRSCLIFGLVAVALAALGLVVLSSAGTANGLRLKGDAYYFLKRQCVFLAVGLCVAAFFAWFDYRWWRDLPLLAILFYLGTFVLVCAVFLWPKVNGSHRWIPIGPVRLQPSELAKLAIVVALSVWMEKIRWRVESFRWGVLIPSAMIGVLAAPVLLAPDFGSVMVIASVGGLVLWLAGAKFLHLLVPLCVGAAVFGVKLYFNGNRMGRLTSFGSEMSNTGADYQVYQALVAIANGGVGGAGLGESMQKHLYLPEAHTDFVFAVGAEELGLFFTITVIVLYALFFAYAVYFACRSKDRLGRYLAMGMGFIIFFQAMFNLGVVSRALPTKGMALPFFSYGGTNLLCAFFAVGTLLSVGIHSQPDRRRLKARRRG